MSMNLHKMVVPLVAAVVVLAAIRVGRGLSLPRNMYGIY